MTTITDFSVADDTIRLDARAFTGLAAGALPGAALTIIGTVLSTPTPDPSPQGGGESATRLIYDRDTGSLAYDADGVGAGAAVTIARLTAGLALTADDFVVM